ncbi:MAG TPA: hypothetical protein VFV51_05905 [Vicinamibacterales bacterium]|nr:hypothetical protein [Vicinamibacterales bacterium]
MANIEPSGHNIGELIRQQGPLATREVLALIHEVCRDTAAAFPRSAEDLWLTPTGELLIARSDQLAAPIDPRAGVADLLENMLPPDGNQDPARQVPSALRGLPSRLRATTEDVGPRDRRDLMSILSWHLAADPRAVMQEFTQRVFEPHAPAPQAEAHALSPLANDRDELELFPVTAERDTSPAPAVAPLPQRSRARLSTALAILAFVLLLIGIGTGSYWVFREADGAGVAEEQASAPASQIVVSPQTSEPTPAPPVAASQDATSPPATSPTAAPPTAAAPTAALPAAAPPTPPAAIATATAATAAQSDPEPLRLQVADGAFSPAFAATGRELFFHAGRESGRLLVANLDDRGGVSRVSAVRNDGVRDYHPRISSDGRWIAFDSDRDGERGVYVAQRDGANLQRVSGAGYAAVPSWSPDMKWLAFVRGETNRPRVWNLWLRNIETGALRRHTSHRSGQVWGASWFPDGRSLAYSHDQQLIISHLDGRKSVVIASPIRGRLVRTPAVSPDGRVVVFQVYKDGVWLFDVASRTTRRILDDPTAEEFAWSPGGDRIAYHSRRDGAWKIWVMKVTA